MKIKSIIESTGVSRQTIHYYLREGLLPKPRKTKSNQAEYDQGHIERILLIKDLQERFFLPLSVIKEIVGSMGNLDRNDTMLRLKAENLAPLTQFLPESLATEKAFLEETGLSADRLAHFEQYGIISPTVVNGKKIFFQDDVSIGKVLGTMRRIGFSVEKGFPKHILRQTKERFEVLIYHFNKTFVRAALEIMSVDELKALKKPATELMAVFFYHLYRRLARQDLDTRIRKAGTPLTSRRSRPRER